MAVKRPEFSLRCEEDAFMREILVNIMLGQERNVELLYSTVHDRVLASVLKSILMTGTPVTFKPVKDAPTYSYVRWICRCLAKRGSDFDCEMPEGLYISSLLQIGSKDIEEFAKILMKKEAQNFSDVEIARVFSVVKLLRKKYAGLYRALNEQIDEVLGKIDPQKVYETFNLESFALSTNFNTAYFASLEVGQVSSSQVRKLWMLPNIFLNSQATTVFQNLFQCAEQYPKRSMLLNPEESDDSFITLVNESICKRKGFFDLIMRFGRPLLIDKKVNEYKQFTEPFPELRAVGLALEIVNVQGESKIFEDFVDYCVDGCGPSIISNVMNRFKNDTDLLSILRYISGVAWTADDLVKSSLPWVVREGDDSHAITMKNFDVLEEFRARDLFVVPDQDRHMDFAFISAYKIIMEVMYNISSGEVPEFASNVADIESESVKNALLTDVFSLLFVKRKDGSFVCAPTMAQPIVVALRAVDHDNVYFQRATDVIAYAIETGQTELESVFSSVGNTINSLMAVKSFHLAKKLAQSDRRVLEIIKTAEAVHKVATDEDSAITEDVNRALVDVECFMSLNRDLGFETDETAALKRKRREVQGNPLLIFDPISLMAILEILQADIVAPGLDLPDDGWLKAFRDFERAQKDGGRHIRSLREVVAEIMSDTTATWEQAKATLGSDKVVEQLFQHGSTENVVDGSEVCQTLRNLYPLAFVCLSKTMEGECKNARIVEAAVGKQGEKHIESDMLNVEAFLRECDDKLIEISEEQVETMLDSVLATKPLRCELINELYLIRPNTVCKIVCPMMMQLSVRALKEMDAFAGVRNLHEMDASEGTVDDQIEVMLDKKLFAKASRVAVSFGRQDLLNLRVDKLIREGNMTQDEILNMKNDIPGSIPIVDMFLAEVTEKEAVKEASGFYDEIVLDAGQSSDVLTSLEVIQKGITIVTPGIIEKTVSGVHRIVRSLSVNDVASEIAAAQTMSRLSAMLLGMKLKAKRSNEGLGICLNRVDLVDRFTKNGFFGRFGTCYSFEDFPSDMMGKQLISICEKYDCPSLLIDLQSVWGAGMDLLKGTMSCFALGMFEDGLARLQQVVNVMTILNEENKENPRRFVDLLSVSLPMDLTAIELIYTPDSARTSSKTLASCILEGDPSEFTRSVSQGEVRIPCLRRHIAQCLVDEHSIVASSPQLAALNRVFDVIGSVDSKIRYLASRRMFDEAFLLFETNIINQAQRTSTFLKDVMLPAVWSLNWNAFLRHLMKRAGAYEQVVRDIFAFMRQKSLPICLFEMQKGLRFYDDAIRTGMGLISNATSWKSGLAMLSELKSIINKSMADRTPERNPGLQELELITLQQRVSVQMSIWRGFMQTGRLFDADLNILTAEENALKLAAHLLLSTDIGYVLAICEMPGVSLSQICDMTIELIARGAGTDLPSFFKQLSQLDKETYDMIIYPSVTAIRRRVVSDKMFITFVKANLKGIDVKARALAAHGFRDDALSIAKGNQALTRAIMTGSVK